MDTLTQSAGAGAAAGADADGISAAAQRLITWVTIGGLVLGTYGTVSAVMTLTFGTNPADRPFNSPTYDAIHRLAVVTVLSSQVLQLVGAAALWRRRLLGRALLLGYATLYLCGLFLIQGMRMIDGVSLPETMAGQEGMTLIGERHLLVYGSVFPLCLIVILTRPWVKRLLRRKGEPLPGACGAEGSASCGCATGDKGNPDPAQRQAA
jgi:hypothetical protein